MGVEAAVVRRTLLDVLDGPCEHYDSHKLAYGLAALDRLLQRLERLEKATENFLQTADVEAFYHATTQLVVLDSVLGELRAAVAAITQEEERK